MKGRTSLPAVVVCALLFSRCGAFQISPLGLRNPSRPSSRALKFQPRPRAASLATPSPLTTAVHRRTRGGVDAEAPTTDRSNEGALSKLVGRIKNALRVGRRGRSIAAFFLSLSLFLLPSLTAFPDAASAVHSGGRMGGSFSGRSTSRSYSSPSRGSGLGGGYSRGYGRGCSSGYYSRPNIIFAPRRGPMYYRPHYSPYYAPSPGAGVAVARPNPFRMVPFLVGLCVVASHFSSSVDGFQSPSSVLGPGVSVAELSIALDVSDRDSPNSILSALSRLSKTARTDRRSGVQNLTSQVALELLRRKASIVAASSSASRHRDGNWAQRVYNDLAIEQRSKFERETLSQYGGVEYSDPHTDPPRPEYAPKATIAVVTILLLIEGDHTSKKLSSNIGSVRDAEEALRCIAADATADECLRGAEILWCPEQREDTLTMRDIVADYPRLRSL